MTLKELEAYRNGILRDRNAARHYASLTGAPWTPEDDAIEGARAVLGMCYIGRAAAKRVGSPGGFRKVFPRLP